MRLNSKVNFKTNFYSVYHFADIVDNVLWDPIEYAMASEDFFHHENILELTRPFQKRSAFHHYIRFIIEACIYDDDINEFDMERFRFWLAGRKIGLHDDTEFLQVENIGIRHGIKVASFFIFFEDLEERGSDLDAPFEYYEYLREGRDYLKLISKISAEVFEILFLNRSTMTRFNDLMRDQALKVDDREIFDAIVVNRTRTNVPDWVQHAVYHRDKGKCVYCRSDLSPLLGDGGGIEMDHIIPLAEGGINDVTNLQLSCRACNAEKGGKYKHAPDIYTRHYPVGK